ncbi:MAG: single-stranded DNA-binding protein [Bacteroidetes bacterium]|nr:single-stranded DNA-binding protein [Bacteroidota bacterium]
MYNKLILIGRLGKDAEARGPEKNIASIDVATTNFYTKKNGENVEEVEWTNCVAFGKLAESIIQKAKKGDLVLVEGLKKTDTYMRDGVDRIRVYMLIDSYRRLAWKDQEGPLAQIVRELKEKNAIIPD